MLFLSRSRSVCAPRAPQPVEAHVGSSSCGRSATHLDLRARLREPSLAPAPAHTLPRVPLFEPCAHGNGLLLELLRHQNHPPAVVLVYGADCLDEIVVRMRARDWPLEISRPKMECLLCLYIHILSLCARAHEIGYFIYSLYSTYSLHSLYYVYDFLVFPIFPILPDSLTVKI